MASGGGMMNCRHHLNAVLINDCHEGDLICSECGLVVAERLMNGINLTTNIEPSRMSSFDRRLVRALEGIETLADHLNLPEAVIATAKSVFKKFHDGKHTERRNTLASESACLYIACRKESVPITFKEICVMSKIGRKEILKHFKLILVSLDMSVKSYSTSDFMPRFCGILGLPIGVEKTASHIGRRAVALDIVPGRSPVSVASAAIYMASFALDQNLTKEEIGDIAGVAERTIRKSYDLMYPLAANLFPQDFQLDLNIPRI